MSVTAMCLFESGYIPGALTTIYTSPTGVRTIIDGLAINNVTGSNATFSIYLVPFLASPGPSNLLMASTTTAGALAENLIFNQVLNAGDYIAMIAGTASALVLRISGRQCS